MKRVFPVLFLFIVSALSVRSFFLPGFIPTHDGEYHIVRLWQFDRNIRDGELFPVWAPDLNSGYGVPVFEFFYPLPSFIGEFFHTLGFGFISSFKLTLAFGLIVSSITFYLWARSFFPAMASIVGSIAYVLAPYHIVDVSVRGSVGEVWALALVPIVLYLITRLPERHTPGSIVFLWIPVASTLLLISHNILGLLFFMFSFAYGFIICFFKKKPYRKLLISLAGSLLASMFFWLPIIFESKYVTGLNIINYREHFPVLYQLIFPSWGSGLSVPGISDQMSFQIGLVHITASLIALYLALRQKNYMIISLLAVFFLAAFFMLENSDVLWHIISPLQLVQYPWRLLSVSVLLSSFMVAFICGDNTKRGVVVLGLTILAYWLYTMPVTYQPRQDSLYTANPQWTSGTTTWGNTFNIQGFAMPENAGREEFMVSDGNGQITDVSRSARTSTATIVLEQDSLLTTKRAYFPGWKVYVDGKENQTYPTGGLVSFPLTHGKHSIIIRFGQSLIRRIASFVSVGFIGLGLFFATKQLYENRHRYFPS